MMDNSIFKKQDNNETPVVQIEGSRLKGNRPPPTKTPVMDRLGLSDMAVIPAIEEIFSYFDKAQLLVNVAVYQNAEHTQKEIRDVLKAADEHFSTYLKTLDEMITSRAPELADELIEERNILTEQFDHLMNKAYRIYRDREWRIGRR